MRPLISLLFALLTMALGSCSPAAENPFVGTWFDARDQPLPSIEGRGLVLEVFRGTDDHCHWGSATFMLLAWPLGSVASYEARTDPERVRQYVRDPEGIFGSVELASSFDPDASLPRQAESTGFHRGRWELWINSSDSDRHVYIVGEKRVEQWPRAKYPIFCR